MPDSRALIVSAEPLLRMGLRHLLTVEAGVAVCGEAGCAIEALALQAEHRPGLVVISLGQPGGEELALIKDLRRSRECQAILVIARGVDPQNVQRAFRAGARGYLSTSDDQAELLLALSAVKAGSLYVSRRAANGLLVHLTSARSQDRAENDLDVLSDREMEIFRLIGHGLGCKDIAGRLNISVKTVETHRQRMKEKLHLHTGSELNRHAARNAVQKPAAKRAVLVRREA